MKLEDGKWYLISNNSLGDCAGIYCEKDREFSIYSNLQVPMSVVEIVSEMAPVKQEEPEPEYEYNLARINDLESGVTCYIDEVEHLIIGWHPEHPVLVLENPDGEMITAVGGKCYFRKEIDKRQKFVDECKKYQSELMDGECIYGVIYDNLVNGE